MEDESPTIIALVQKDIMGLVVDMHDLKLAIMGDNNGRKGIVRTLDEIKEAIGYGSELSIVVRVRDLEKWRDGIQNQVNRILYPTAVSLLLSIIGFVAGLVTGKITIHF